MEIFNSDNVQSFLRENASNIEIMFFDGSTATSQQAADNVGCELGQIVKSLLFIVSGDQPVLVLASGDHMVDSRKLSDYFSVGRKKVKIAKPEQCIDITGYAPGGVPPVAHRTKGLQILIDSQLQRFNMVYAAAGSSNSIFPVNISDLQELTSGTFVDVTVPA